MKHLENFQNNKVFYIYINISTTTPEIIDIQLFDNEISAQNYYTVSVNDVAKNDKYYDNDPEYDDDDIILNFKQATDYVNQNDYSIQIVKTENIHNYKLPNNLIMKNNMKNFNL